MSQRIWAAPRCWKEQENHFSLRDCNSAEIFIVVHEIQVRVLNYRIMNLCPIYLFMTAVGADHLNRNSQNR